MWQCNGWVKWDKRDDGGTRMMRGQKGYPIKCESCGHEDAVFFREPLDSLKELAFKVTGKKCPECGGTMKIDPGKVIKC